METHDHHCETADVGSVCDCHCAGAKHAILHTKGGVPGAGAVTKAAQKAAHAAQRPVVVNNRATPKEGSRVAPGAPKSFKTAHDERRAQAPAPAEVKRASSADTGVMHVESRRRNGETVQDTAVKAGTVAEVAGPARKTPAALRDVLQVLDNPGQFADMSAASRYAKLTPDLLKQMSPTQKQAMLDDMRSRAKSYTAKHATGQKLTRGYNTLVFGSSDLKEGMQAADNFQAKAGDKVTHPQFGHGRVTSVASEGGKTTGAVVNFGDRTETVAHKTLTFGHTPGGDTNAEAKAAAGQQAAAARLAAGGKKLADFADRLTAYDKAVKDSDLVAKARLGTKIGSSRKDYSALGEFNDIHQYSPETFRALPPADQAKVVAAVERIAHMNSSPEVQHRVSDTLHAWTGKGIDIAPTPDPEHVVQAKRALAGQGTTLPTSMAIAQVDDHSLKNRFTVAERSQLRDRAYAILAGMRPDAPDRAGLQRFVDRVDQLDGVSNTPGALVARAKEAERRSNDKRLSFEKRQEARAQMHDLNAQAFNAANPHRTAGPGADTFRGKKVKPLPESQQPVLEAIAAGSGYRALPRGPVTNLERTGHIQTIFSNDRAVLTEDGHIKLAAQRGDGHHQKLNEKVAQLRDAHEQAGRTVQAHAAARGKDPNDRTWSRRSFDLQQEQQHAYGQWQYAISERNQHVAGPGGGGPVRDASGNAPGQRDKTERVLSRNTPDGPVTDTAKPARKKSAGKKLAEKPAESAAGKKLAPADRVSRPGGRNRVGAGEGGFIGAGTTRVREHDGVTYTVHRQHDGTWKLTNGANGGLSMGIYATLLKAGEILDQWLQALHRPKRQSGLVSIPLRRHVPGEGVRR